MDRCHGILLLGKYKLHIISSLNKYESVYKVNIVTTLWYLYKNVVHTQMLCVSLKDDTKPDKQSLTKRKYFMKGGTFPGQLSAFPRNNFSIDYESNRQFGCLDLYQTFERLS